MEKALRSIGLIFLYVANAVQNAKNAIHSYLFDLLYDDDHLPGGSSR